jgi:hypothetical protein
MNKRPRHSDDLFGFGEGWDLAAPPKRPPSLFELTTRAMTREQLSRVSPSQFPGSKVEPLLAMTNRVLKKAVRKLIILLNAAKAVPVFIAGIPRAAWHTLLELTPTTTDADLSRGLYRHVNYRFLPRSVHLAKARPYTFPFRVRDLFPPAPQFNDDWKVALQSEIPIVGQLEGVNVTLQSFLNSYKIDNFRSIRFHSR